VRVPWKRRTSTRGDEVARRAFAGGRPERSGDVGESLVWEQRCGEVAARHTVPRVWSNGGGERAAAARRQWGGAAVARLQRRQPGAARARVQEKMVARG
jgi:hypothetical protein